MIRRTLPETRSQRLRPAGTSSSYGRLKSPGINSSKRSPATLFTAKVVQKIPTFGTGLCAGTAMRHRAIRFELIP